MKNKIIPFIIISKRIKYLEINLSKEVKDPYVDNYKALMKEIKDKGFPCSWFIRIDTVKMSKAIYRFTAVSVKIPMAFFMLMEKPFWNLYGTTKTMQSQSNPKGEQ